MFLFIFKPLLYRGKKKKESPNIGAKTVGCGEKNNRFAPESR
jgi:hypothetical protein